MLFTTKIFFTIQFFLSICNRHQQLTQEVEVIIDEDIIR